MSRQCLVGGNYSLIEQRNVYDDNNKVNIPAWTPNPDYWTAWMWRYLISGKNNNNNNIMLAVNQVMPYEGDYIPETRMYMVCTPIESPYYKKGSVTSIYINQASTNKSIILYQGQRYSNNNYNNIIIGDGGGGGKNNIYLPPTFSNLPRYEYIMTSLNGNILSRSILVNNVILQMNQSKMPLFPNPLLGKTENMIVPNNSYGFAIYPSANASACFTIEK
jgi:hypothetical protein